MSERTDLVVVGGGISGVSLAAACARAGRSVRILEKTEAAGGCVRTHREPDGFWVELGAHTCYSSYGTLLGLLEERGALEALRPRVRVPFRLLVEGQVRSIASELGILELLRSAPRVVTTSKQGQTVRGYYSRLVGRRNYDRVFGPLFAAVPSQPADDFPADMLFKRRARRKDVLRSFTLRGGLQTIIEILTADPRITVSTGVEVRAIERDGDGLAVRTAGGAAIAARHVALACPPAAAAAIARPAFPELAARLERIVVTPIDSVGVVVRRDRVRLPPFAGVIPLDGRFYSIVSRDTVDDPTWRGFACHLAAGVGREETLERVGAVLGVSPRDGFERVVTRSVVLPSPRLGHGALVRELEGALAAARAPLYLTGNYFGGLSIEDCVIRSTAEARRLLAA